jgi:beta-galactosidase
MTSIRCRWQLGVALAVCVAMVPASSRATSPAPTITVQPEDQTGYISETVTFVADAKGKKPLAFQWYRNGAAISGATSETLSVQVQSVAQNGTLFHAVVSSSYGSAQTRSASLRVHQAIPIGV